MEIAEYGISDNWNVSVLEHFFLWMALEQFSFWQETLQMRIEMFNENVSVILGGSFVTSEPDVK